MGFHSIQKICTEACWGLSSLVRVLLLIFHRNFSLDSITPLFFGLGAYVLKHMVHLFQSPSASLWDKEVLHNVSK